jgi:CRP-like cAMP-binding protein
MNYNIGECLFSKRDFIKGFSDVLSLEDIDVLQRNSVSRNIKKGYPVFQEGNTPIGLIYLKEGSAKVYKYKSGKREQIVRLVGHSSFVGYKALFAEKDHTTSASAIDDSEIIIIEKATLFDIMDKNPKFSRFIIKSLANELSFNFERLINLTQKHVRGRLAETLILMSEIYGFKEDGVTLDINITRENIGFFSNMTTANAIRTIKSFEKEDLIIASNHQIKLLNKELIREIGVRG